MRNVYCHSFSRHRNAVEGNSCIFSFFLSFFPSFVSFSLFLSSFMVSSFPFSIAFVFASNPSSLRVLFLSFLLSIFLYFPLALSLNYFSLFCLVWANHPSWAWGRGSSHVTVRMQRSFPRSPLELHWRLLQFKYASSNQGVYWSVNCCGLGNWWKST